jgi:hypothetical protein
MSVTNAQLENMLRQQNQDIANQAAAAGVPQIVKAYYSYTLYFASVASGANSTANTQIQSDSAFLVQALSFATFDLTTNGAITAPFSTIQITIQASGSTLFDQPIPITNAFGTGQFPFVMPTARLLPANSVVTGALVNVASTNAQRYYLTLHGKKLFNYNG